MMSPFGAIAQAGVVIAEALDHIGRATHDEYRLAAPLDLQHAARLELADVDLYRSALGLRARARLPGRKERNRCEGYADGARQRGGGGQELPPSLVDCLGHRSIFVRWWD